MHQSHDRIMSAGHSGLLQETPAEKSQMTASATNTERLLSLHYLITKRAAKITFFQKQKKQPLESQVVAFLMSGYCDSNTGPSGPKPDALTNCATPRLLVSLSFGTANIDTKNKSAKLFSKFCTFYCIFPDGASIIPLPEGKSTRD